MTLLVAVFACLAGSLVAEGWVPVSVVDPTRAQDSESVPARGYPHPWLVSKSTIPELAPASKRIIGRNLSMSFFFWLAVTTPLLACARAVFRRLRAARTALQYPSALRVFGGLATAACAATYAHLFIDVTELLLLLTGTCLAVLPPLQVFASESTRKVPSRIAVLLVIGAVLLTAASFGGFGLPLVPFVAVFLLLTVVVGLGFVYWLAEVPPEAELMQ